MVGFGPCRRLGRRGGVASRKNRFNIRRPEAGFARCRVILSGIKLTLRRGTEIFLLLLFCWRRFAGNLMPQVPCFEACVVGDDWDGSSFGSDSLATISLCMIKLARLASSRVTE